MMLLLGSSCCCCCCCWALIVMMLMIYGRSAFVGGFRSRVGGADLEEVNGLAGLFFFLSLFREEKIIRLSAPTKHPK